MGIERLTPDDEVMLWPDAVWPQDIGALAIVDGCNLFDANGDFRIERVRQAVAGRLNLVPRFRQLLYIPPKRLGGPLWVDAPDFDLEKHIGMVSLAWPADEAQLLLAVERLRRRRLDRSRPLWDMWFLPGLADRRVGLFMRTHHAIADGMAGVATLATFLDVDPDAPPAPPEPWTPAPWPTDEDLLADSRYGRLRDRRQRLSALAHPMTSVRRLHSAWPAIRELIADPQVPPTSLEQVVGPDRGLVLVRDGLDVVKKVAHANGAKANDVLLTAIAGGLRQLLAGRAEHVDVVRVYVPVTLRRGDVDRARGNMIADMVVPLNLGLANPVLRLQRIAADTAERKRRARPSIGKMPTGGLAGRVFLNLIKRQRINVTSADLPGPPMPLYIAGARLLEIFPVLPLIGNVSLGVGAMSYAGQFNITAVADRDAYPDLDVFAEGMQNELDALRASTTSTAAVASL